MATNVTETSQVKSSGVKFEDFFSFNITEGEVNQNKIRIVKVSGKNYIAFSRYFHHKESNTYRPTKCHFFISAEHWPSIKTGLKLLNAVLRAEEKKNVTNVFKKGYAGDRGFGGDVDTDLSTKKHITMPFSRPISGDKPTSSTFQTPIHEIVSAFRNTLTTKNVEPTFTFRNNPIAGTLPNFSYKRQRGRPPKAVQFEPLSFTTCSSHSQEPSCIPVQISRSGAKAAKFDEVDADEDATDGDEAEKNATTEDSTGFVDIYSNDCC